MDFTRYLTLPAFAGMTPQPMRQTGVFLLAAAAHFATMKAWISRVA
jgi:formyltetrahydrofolate hydrolase